MGEILITRRNITNIGNGAYELLADIELASSATIIEINGLNIVKGSEYVLLSDLKTTTTTGYLISLFINTYTTETSYYSQIVGASATTVSLSRANSPSIGEFDTTVNSNVYIMTRLKLTNDGKFAYISSTAESYNINNSIWVRDFNGASTFSVSSITKLTISTTQANNFGAGSRVQLYKIGGA